MRRAIFALNVGLALLAVACGSGGDITADNADPFSDPWSGPPELDDDNPASIVD
jgi:hypothetical protein